MIRGFNKRATLILVALSGLGLTGGALAYFSTTGSGHGNGVVGTNQAVTLRGTTSGTLYPGTSLTVTLTADNPASGHEEIGTVHLSGIRACAGGTNNDSEWNPGAGTCTDAANGGAEVTTCEDLDSGSGPDAGAHDFYMADVVENQDLASGTAIALTHSGTLTMNNLSTSQNQCKSVNLYLQLSS